MTCIAAVTDGKTVWMGGDSAGVSGWDLTPRKDEKVYRRGEWLLGFTSSFRMGQLLGYRLTIPPFDGDEPDMAYMVGLFIDAVRDCLKTGGWAEKDKDRERGGCFLAACRGRIFRIDDDFQVGEPLTPYDAVGCGEAYAKGALFSNGKLCPENRILQALNAAEAHSAGVRGPFIILSTDDPL